jgi:ABC-type oligopeptide transport system substrate-binding subunit
VPDVAASWEVLDGGRRYLFHLRDDVFWSDGMPVTAGDFECAWRRVLDPAAGWEDAGLLYDIKGAKDFQQGRGRDLGVRALDDTTLSVELEGPTGYLLHLLACWVAYPVPRHLVEAQGADWADPDHIVTNGPFAPASWRPGDSMVLERYPRYHGLVTGNVDRVEITFYQMERLSAPVDMYLVGLSDVLQLPAEQSIETMDRLRKSHTAEWVTLPSANTGVMVFDVDRPPFDDARVRRAFAHAMDRGRQVDVTWGGYWETVTGGYVPPGMPGHVPGIALPYDPERARELLAEAGYPGGAGFPEVEFWAKESWRPDPGSPEDPDDLVEKWNNNLNLDIKWRYGRRRVEYGDSIDSAPPHIHFSGWIIDYPDPDCYLRVALQDLSAWRHEPYLELVDRAQRSLDQAERMALYAQAERILVEEVPILPMDYDRKHHLIKPWVRRYPRAANGRKFWKDVVIEEH